MADTLRHVKAMLHEAHVREAQEARKHRRSSDIPDWHHIDWQSNKITNPSIRERERAAKGGV